MDLLKKIDMFVGYEPVLEKKEKDEDAEHEVKETPEEEEAEHDTRSPDYEGDEEDEEE